MENTTKGFWQKPEGKVGMVIPVTIIALLAYFSAAMAPFMLLALQGGFYTLVFAAAAGILFWVATNKELRLLVTTAYQVWMKKITGMVIEMNPIAIIKNHLINLQKSIDEMDASINVVTGENKKIELKINKNNESMTHLMETATIAKRKMDQSPQGSIQYVEFKSKATLDSNQVGRLQKSNSKYIDMFGRGKKLEDILERQFAAAKFVLADMTAEVQIQEEDYKMINASFNAFESARKVMAGDSDENALYLQTMEFMADNLGEKVGKIDRFIKDTSGILTGMDIENESFTNNGMKMIDTWNNMGEDMFITSPKADLQLPSPMTQAFTLPSTKPDVLITNNKYL